MSDRRVRAIRNIYDTTTGNLVVPLGAQGDLLLAFVVPNDGSPGIITKDKDLILRVDFSGTIINVKYGVDVEFVNGLKALLSVLFVGFRLEEVRQSFGTDQSFPHLFPQHIKLFFSSGLHIGIGDDFVTGTLRFTLFVDRAVSVLGVAEVYKTFRVDITDPSVQFVTDHYEWTLNNTAMTTEELIFVRGTLMKEGEHYTLQRNAVGTKVIFSSNLVFDTTPPDIDYLVAVYRTQA
jgi:hypothetical protein